MKTSSPLRLSRCSAGYLRKIRPASLGIACLPFGGLERKDELQVATIDAVEDVPSGNETALMQAVTMHPTAIGLCVGPWIKEWRAYTGGILKVPGWNLRALRSGAILGSR